MTVGLINEEPSCLYLERLTLKKTDNICEVYPKCKEENTESQWQILEIMAGMLSEIRDNRIISVYNTTDY